MWHNFILGPNPDFISSVRQVVNVLFSIVDTIDYLAQFNVLFPTRDLDKWDKRSTQLWMYGLIVSCSTILEKPCHRCKTQLVQKHISILIDKDNLFLQLGLMRDIMIFTKRWKKRTAAVKDNSGPSAWLASNKVNQPPKYYYKHQGIRLL